MERRVRHLHDVGGQHPRYQLLIWDGTRGVRTIWRSPLRFKSRPYVTAVFFYNYFHHVDQHPQVGVFPSSLYYIYMANLLVWHIVLRKTHVTAPFVLFLGYLLTGSSSYFPPSLVLISLFLFYFILFFLDRLLWVLQVPRRLFERCFSSFRGKGIYFCIYDLIL